MSNTLQPSDILHHQRFLKCSSLYSGALDGSWGPKTSKADAEFIRMSASIKKEYGSFDARSEKHISTLMPKAQLMSRHFLQLSLKLSLDVRILSGTRSYSEQTALYRIGRRGIKGENKVTNARAGESLHNFGIAWDIGIFRSGTYLTDEFSYRALGPRILQLLPNLEWGGNWHRFKDWPHYQHRAVAGSARIIKAFFEEGKPFLS